MTPRFFFLILLLLPMSAWSATAPAPDDHVALAGLSSAKAVFDVRTGEPGRLLFIVKLIEQTYDSVRAQGVRPDFVVSFRGGSLPLLRKSPERADEREKAILSEVRERLAALEKGKATLQACNVAATIFKVTPDQLTPGVTMIGNSLISLIGFQNKGYALVPMQ